MLILRLTWFLFFLNHPLYANSTVLLHLGICHKASRAQRIALLDLNRQNGGFDRFMKKNTKQFLK